MARPRPVIWWPAARIHIRAIDRETAIQILQAVDEYLSTGTGDVKKLRPPRDELRLRVGDYRVFFYQLGERAIKITEVRHRSYGYN